MKIRRSKQARRLHPDGTVDPPSLQPLAKLVEVPGLAEAVLQYRQAEQARNQAQDDWRLAHWQLIEQLQGLVGQALVFTNVYEPYHAYYVDRRTLSARHRDMVVGELREVSPTPLPVPGLSHDYFSVWLRGAVSQEAEYYYVTPQTDIGSPDGLAVPMDVLREHLNGILRGGIS